MSAAAVGGHVAQIHNGWPAVLQHNSAEAWWNPFDMDGLKVLEKFLFSLKVFTSISSFSCVQKPYASLQGVLSSQVLKSLFTSSFVLHLLATGSIYRLLRKKSHRYLFFSHNAFFLITNLIFSATNRAHSIKAFSGYYLLLLLLSYTEQLNDLDWIRS